MDVLQISQEVKLSADLLPQPWQVGDTLSFTINLTNPYARDIYPGEGDLPLSIRERYGTMDCLDNSSDLELIEPPSVWPAGKTISLQAKMFIGERIPVGKNTFSLCIQTGDLPPAYAGKGISIELRDKKKE